MDTTDPGFVDRRTLLAATGLAFLPGFHAAGHAAPGAVDWMDSPELKDPWMDDPQRCLENFVRSQGDLSGRVSPQWWRGGLLGIFAERQPEVMFRLESCEMKRIRQLDGGAFEFQVRLLTCVKDAETDAIINGLPWNNPLTGETAIVKPTRAAFARIVKLTDRGILEIDPETGHEVLIRLHWTARGPYMMYNGQREYPDDRPMTSAYSKSIQYTTCFHDRAEASDFSAPRLEMQFNATHVSPFPSWMKMPAGAGLTVWHASGHKAENVAGLPPDYLEQLHAYMPEVQSWLDADY